MLRCALRQMTYISASLGRAKMTGSIRLAKDQGGRKLALQAPLM